MGVGLKNMAKKKPKIRSLHLECNWISPPDAAYSEVDKRTKFICNNPKIVAIGHGYREEIKLPSRSRYEKGPITMYIYSKRRRR